MIEMMIVAFGLGMLVGIGMAFLMVVLTENNIDEHGGE